jgi:predicted small lipoprotein YifL
LTCSAIGRAGIFVALLAAFAAVASCGQRGPLTLPDSARPIERLDGASAPAASPGASSQTGAAQPVPGAAGASPPVASEPEDDEAESKARRPENER